MSFSGSNIPNIGSYTVNGLRFGFAGEDAVAGEDRNFDAGSNIYTVTGFGNGLNLLQTDGINWLNAIGLSDVLATIQANSILNSTSASLNLAPNGTVNLESYDPVNANQAIYHAIPDELYFQVSTATGQVVRLEMTPNAFSTNGLNLSYDDGAGTVGRIKLKPGFLEVNADTFRVLTTPGTSIYLDINPAAGYSTMGDQIGTRITATQGSDIINLTSGLGKYRFDNCPAYNDNAAALLGGLAVGMIYRDGDNLKIVH